MKTEAEILALTSPDQFKDLSPEDFAGREMTQAEFTYLFTLCDAIWLHSGDPAAPHAELTSGLCSNGFIDTLRTLRYTPICEIMADQSVKKIRATYDGPVDWVIGSDHAAATFSYAVAHRMKTQHDFTEKGPDKTQLWKRFTIQEQEKVLQVEEIVAAGSTIAAVREGLRRDNPQPVSFAPVVFTLIHRTDVTEVEGSPLLYLFHFDIWASKPEDCPLCKAGSKRLRPKKNWQELTQKI